jgi:ribonucleoside-diphosphate reductase alpha chain
MEVISYYAIQTSSNLAKERGTYASYKGSKWDRGIFPMDTLDLLEAERGVRIEVPRTGRMDWNALKALVKAQGMRNSNTMACAPTATISNIAGCLPTIEPIYKNLYVKSNQGGDFTILNEYLVKDLKAINMWNENTLSAIKYYDGSIAEIAQIPEKIRNKYKEVFDIDPKWLIKAAAYRGKWIDQAQSLNLYFRGTSGAQLSEAYMYAWKMGVKTTYYLRTLAASQVEKSTLAPSAHGATHLRKTESGATTFKETAPMSAQAQMPAMATVAVAATQAAVSAAPIAPPPTITIPTAPRVKSLKNDLGEDAICEGCQ